MASSGVKKEASSVPADVDGNTWKKSLMRSCHHGFLIHQLYFYVEMTGPDAAAVLTILALLCFSLLLQLLFRYLIMRLLFCFSSFVTSRQLRWEHATLFLACLKVFLSYSMHRSFSPHFDPLDSSSVDWFHLQKLIPSGPLYHDCISPKLCFLLYSCPCRIVGQAAECKCSYWVYHPLEKPILLLLPLFLCLFFSGLSPYPFAPQIFLMPLLS